MNTVSLPSSLEKAADGSCPQCGAALERAWAGLCPRCLAASALRELEAPELAEPIQTLGDYQLIEELARGASGVVWKARQRGLKRLVALKVVRAMWLPGEEGARRFRQEAEMAARLRHLNIVAVHEVGDADGMYFLSMELIEGMSLAHRMRTSRLAPRECAGLLAKIARAVQHAHERGVLHRDLKPANILLDAQGEPHVADFGLARLAGSESDLTRTGAAIGTPAYMSPEAARGERELTIAADVWSLGAILFELLAGHPPFVAENTPALLKKIVEEADPRVAGAPRILAIICQKCLRKEPSKRYASAAELAADLERWLAGEPIRARSAGALERAWLWALRRPLIAALLALVAMLIVAGGVGATIALARIDEARQRAEDELWHSRLVQARAGRLTDLPDRKHTGLAAIAAAARLRPSLELRHEALAHLALEAFVVPDRARPGTAAVDAAFTRYATYESDQTISVRRLEDDHELIRLPWHHGPPQLLFSPHGEALVARGPDRVVHVFHLATGTARFTLPDVWHVSISPDSRHLATVHTGFVRISDAADGRELARRTATAGLISPPAFHPDPACELIALGQGKTIELWNWPRGTVEQSFDSPQPVHSIAWAGNQLVFGDDSGHVIARNFWTGGGWTVALHRGAIYALSFSPDGERLVTRSFDATACVLDAATGHELVRSARWYPQSFDPSGTKLLCISDRGWGIGRWERAAHPRRLQTPDANNLAAGSFSPDGRWLAVTRPTGFYVLDAATGQCLLSQPAPGILDARFWPDEKSLLTVERTKARIWKMVVSENHLKLEAARDLASAETATLQIGCPDGPTRYVLPFERGDGAILDLGGRENTIWLRGQGILRTPTVSLDRRWLATGTFHGKGLNLWDARTGAHVRLLGATNCTAAFSPDGRWLAGAFANDTRIFETGTWKIVREWPTEISTDLPGRSAWSRDGRVFAHARRLQLIDLIDTRTWELLGTLTSPERRHIFGLEFSPDGATLAVTTDNNLVELWDLAGLGEELTRLGLGWDLPAPAALPPLMPEVEPLPKRPARP